MRALRWWQFGLMGGAVLSLATLEKIVKAMATGSLHDFDWTQNVSFASAVFGMGFVCGLVVWVGRGWYTRLGLAGDALLGLVVMNTFFVLCMLLFSPDLLREKFTSGGILMLGLASVIGLIGGAWTGRDIRSAAAKSKRKSVRPSTAPPAPDNGQPMGENCTGMYETLIMLKPDASFDMDDLYRVIIDVTRFASAKVERRGNVVHISAGQGSLTVAMNEAAHVLEESNELAQQFGIPSHGCHTRFEMAGDDPEMSLFNVYLMINESLNETGKFVIFDQQECKALFDEVV